LRAALQTGDGTGVEDDATLLQMLECGARHVEIAVDVRLEGPVPLLVGDRVDIRLVLLVRGVVHEDVELAKGIHGLLHGFRAERRARDVAGKQQCCAPLVLNRLLRLLRVGLFLFQVNDRDVRPFACEQHGHRATDARVAPRDERDFALQFVGPPILGRLVPRTRLHVGFETRLLQMLLRERRFGLG